MRSCWRNTGSEIQQLVTRLRLLVSINLICHSSWVQWNRLGLEQQLVCKTLPLSLGWISGHSSPAGSYEQFDSWGRFSHLSKPLIRSPMGRKNAFLVFYSLLPAVVGFLFSPRFFCLRNPIGFGSDSGILSYCFAATTVFLFGFFFLPQFTNPGDIFAHVHSNGKTVRNSCPDHVCELLIV